MARRAAVVCGVLLLAGVGVAATYTVTNDDDSGVGSLRWAIGRANTHAGADTITFEHWVGGSIIQPETPLPAITDDGTTVDGDLNDDGLPDIGVDGNVVDPMEAPTGSGITVVDADDCWIGGLVVTRCLPAGIWLQESARSRVAACHVGVNRGGTQAWPNWIEADIVLRECTDCTIGGTPALRRNVLAGGLSPDLEPDGAASGIHISGGERNRIIGNYIGIRRDGSGVLGNGHVGAEAVRVFGGTGHVIGGAAAGAGNVIGGVTGGITLYWDAAGTRILGNLFGLAADGNTLAPLEGTCVTLIEPSTRTIIGGTTAAARNVFAGTGSTGIFVDSDAGGRVLIQGNYFGTNAAGTAHRGQMQIGVDEASAGDDVVIGGSTAAAGNFLALSGGYGVKVRRGGDPLIRNNVFGMLPNGQDADAMFDGVYVTGEADPTIRDNEFANALGGVVISGSHSGAGIFGNRFHDCEHAVYIMGGASCRLGNLGNRSAGDDGGNVFNPNNTWHIYNTTANDIRAEGNRFGTHSYEEISAKIHDQVDNGSLGLVDFDPLFDGESPSGAAEGVARLAVTSICAQQTAAGAEVTFSLSAPATVEARVLSIAGRPVATVCRARDCAAGANRLLWDAMSDQGLRVPDGVYLIEVVAAAPDGTQSRALAQVSIRR